jgi:SMC interacting uncharacterized protein involved in chromosome segregation
MTDMRMCQRCGQRYDHDTETHACPGSLDERLDALHRRVSELDDAIADRLAAIREFDKRIEERVSALERLRSEDRTEVGNELRALKDRVDRLAVAARSRL